MRFTIRQRAGEYARFAPGCFDGLVGDEVPLRLPDGSTRSGCLVAASVATDGRTVELTFETDLEFVAKMAGAFSYEPAPDQRSDRE